MLLFFFFCSYGLAVVDLGGEANLWCDSHCGISQHLREGPMLVLGSLRFALTALPKNSGTCSKKPHNLFDLQLYECFSLFSLCVDRRHFLGTLNHNKARLGHNVTIHICFQGKALLSGLVYLCIDLFA